MLIDQLYAVSDDVSRMLRNFLTGKHFSNIAKQLYLNYCGIFLKINFNYA